MLAGVGGSAKSRSKPRRAAVRGVRMSELAIDRLPPDDATVAAPLLPSQRYVNRELSWLAFNERVLEEASSSGHPLLERGRFLSISDSNLVEFYMVRVAGLKELAAGGVPVKSDDGLTPDQQLSAIAEVAGGLRQRQQRCWADLQKRLRAEGISILDHEALTGDDRSWLRQLFVDRLLPVLTPIAIDPAHPFPFIPNRALAMVVESRREDGTQINALVLVPDRVERFIRLPGEKGRFSLVEEVLLAVGLAELFPGMTPLGHGLFSALRARPRDRGQATRFGRDVRVGAEAAATRSDHSHDIFGRHAGATARFCDPGDRNPGAGRRRARRDGRALRCPTADHLGPTRSAFSTVHGPVSGTNKGLWRRLFRSDPGERYCRPSSIRVF